MLPANQSAQPVVVMHRDYLPFGSELPGRSSGNHRFNFQGEESDQEWLNGAVAFKYRIHDTRIGRFLSIDPLAASYPHNSSYAFSENRLIDAIELEGLESFEIRKLPNVPKPHLFLVSLEGPLSIVDEEGNAFDTFKYKGLNEAMEGHYVDKETQTLHIPNNLPGWPKEMTQAESVVVAVDPVRTREMDSDIAGWYSMLPAQDIPSLYQRYLDEDLPGFVEGFETERKNSIKSFAENFEGGTALEIRYKPIVLYYNPECMHKPLVTEFVEQHNKEYPDDQYILKTSTELDLGTIGVGGGVEIDIQLDY